MPPTEARTTLFACRRSEDGGGGARVSVSGELDLATANELELVLRGALHDASRVELDLRGLTFIDLIGLRVILDAARAARSSGRELHVLPAAARVDQLFALTGTSPDEAPAVARA